MQIDYTNILNYITPAVAIATFIYLVKFFGKVIADQHPLVDDRSWHIEISGLYFTLSVLMSAVIGASLAPHSSSLYSSWYVNLLIFFGISIIGIVVYLEYITLYEKIYKTKINTLDGFPQKVKDAIRVIVIFSEKFLNPSLEIILFYLLALSFMSHNILWFTVLCVQTLFTLNLIALHHSLKQIKELPKADIYLIGMDKPIRNAILLKVTDDIVRTRNKEEVIVYNKNQILKLVIKLPKELLG